MSRDKPVELLALLPRSDIAAKDTVLESFLIWSSSVATCRSSTDIEGQP